MAHGVWSRLRARLKNKVSAGVPGTVEEMYL